jgi:hypothetical protein
VIHHITTNASAISARGFYFLRTTFFPSSAAKIQKLPQLGPAGRFPPSWGKIKKIFNCFIICHFCLTIIIRRVCARVHSPPGQFHSCMAFQTTQQPQENSFFFFSFFFFLTIFNYTMEC